MSKGGLTMGYRKLSLLSGHRKMLLRNITTSFLKEEAIETTEQGPKKLNSWLKR